MIENCGMMDFSSSFSIEISEALRIIECPICLEVACPPIHQCNFGHIVCCNCIPDIVECPVCRHPMPAIRVRNLAAEMLTENLTTKPCPNSKFGCKIRLKLGSGGGSQSSNGVDVGHHILHCDYFSRDFCNRIGLGDLLECHKIITKREICTHWKDDHNFMLKHLIVESSEAEVIQDITNISQTETESLKWLPVTFSVFNEHFFLVSELSEKNGAVPSHVTWKCIKAAPAAETISSEFLVKFTLLVLANPEKKLKLAWQGPVMSIDDIDGNIGSYFSVPVETLKLFNATKYQNTEILEWKIKVVIKDRSVVRQPSLTRVSYIQSVHTVPFEQSHKKENETNSTLFQFGDMQREMQNSGVERTERRVKNAISVKSQDEATNNRDVQKPKSTYIGSPSGLRSLLSHGDLNFQSTMENNAVSLNESTSKSSAAAHHPLVEESRVELNQVDPDKCPHMFKSGSMSGIRKAFQQDIKASCKGRPCISNSITVPTVQSSLNNLWFCLQCGSIGCGDENAQGGDALTLNHFKTLRSDCHAIALVLNDSYKSWCFICQSEINNKNYMISDQINLVKRNCKTRFEFSKLTQRSNQPVSSVPIASGLGPPPPANPPTSFQNK